MSTATRDPRGKPGPRRPPFIRETSRTTLLGLAAALLGCGPADRSDPGGPYDLVIAGGTVVDGSGAPARTADIAVREGRIVAVGDLSDAEAADRIDATGLVVTPGFIDTHSHAGGGLATPELSPAIPLRVQGITTVFVNPDGGGPADLAEQRDELRRDGLGVNVAQFVPQGSVRRAVLAAEDRAPTDEELDAMRGLVRAGMELGAWGLSSGTFYAPGSFSSVDEIVELARVAAEYGGAYQSHIRDESNYSIGVVAAVREVVEVARRAGLTGVVTHIKALGPPVWGASEEIVALIEAARAEGVDVYADQYPYPASATGLEDALLPRWVEAGGRDSVQARLSDPGRLPGIRGEMLDNLARRGGADRILFRRHRLDESIEGRYLSELAVERGQHPIDVAIELIRGDPPSIVSFNMHEDDILRFMRQPWTMTASDGDLVPWMEGVPHPRSYGAFSRKIAEYVVRQGAVTLPHAVHSMTGLPADVFGMRDRGRIVEGRIADIAVLDLEAVDDPASFTEPHQLARGVLYLFIGGVAIVREGEPTGELAGRILDRSSSAPRASSTPAGTD